MANILTKLGSKLVKGLTGKQGTEKNAIKNAINVVKNMIKGMIGIVVGISKIGIVTVLGAVLISGIVATIEDLWKELSMDSSNYVLTYASDFVPWSKSGDNGKNSSGDNYYTYSSDAGYWFPIAKENIDAAYFNEGDKEKRTSCMYIK